MDRVRREVGLKEGRTAQAVYDHFKPGVPEFAALLPQGLADRLQRLGPAPAWPPGANPGRNAAEGGHAHACGARWPCGWQRR
jgi:hypothetical protein